MTAADAALGEFEAAARELDELTPPSRSGITSDAELPELRTAEIELEFARSMVSYLEQSERL